MRLPLFGILRLAAHRLRSRPILTLLSLLGVVLAVGTVASVPIFAQAVSYLVLRDELADLSRSKSYAPLTVRISYELRKKPFSLAQAQEMEQTLARIVAEKTGLSAAPHTAQIESPSLVFRSLPESPLYDGSNENIVFKGFSLVVLGDAGQRVRTIDGEPFGQATRPDLMPVWPHAALANLMGVQTGESYYLYPRGADQPLAIYIAGIWQENDPRDQYWGALSMSRDGTFLVSVEDYQSRVEPLFADATGYTAWFFAPSLATLTLDKVDKYAAGLETLPAVIEHVLPGAKIDLSPIAPVSSYVERRDSLSTLLTNFSLPAIGLLFYFLSLLSTVVVQFQREETSILSGRGAGWGLLIGLAVTETLLLILVGLPLGLGTGYLLARFMGQTSGFLTFVARPGFPASLNGANWKLLGVALLLLLVARLIPTINAARRSVVIHLRERSRPVAISWAAKAAVDVPLVLLTLYVYRQLRLQEVPSILRLDVKADAWRDPLFLAAPLLCALTCTLVLVHVFPLVMHPLDRLSTRLPWLSVYMGVRRLLEQSSQYTNALFLVILCLSLGSFYSSMALSLDQWLHDRTYYAVGTDYAFTPSQLPDSGGGENSTASAGGVWALPVDHYLNLPGVEQATRVGEFAANAATPKSSSLRVRFLGIDRVSFPQAAFFRPDFAAVPLNDLMNRLARQRNGLLVSREFIKQHNILEGQKLPLEVSISGATLKVDFVIVGVYNYFPTVFPRQVETLVGNLSYIFDQTADPSAYKVWLKTAQGTMGSEIVKDAAGLEILPTNVSDAQDMLLKESQRAERIGIFGILSIGFMAGSILSWIGLLAYTSASMQGRMQQIGVLKAIGVQTPEALMMEGVEYAGVIMYSIIGGVAAGVVTSYLFVPFFQFNVTAATALPPFLPFIDWNRIFWFALAFASALLVSEVAILYQATRKDIFQALRMGQRE